MVRIYLSYHIVNPAHFTRGRLDITDRIELDGIGNIRESIERSRFVFSANDLSLNINNSDNFIKIGNWELLGLSAGSIDGWVLTIEYNSEVIYSGLVNSLDDIKFDLSPFNIVNIKFFTFHELLRSKSLDYTAPLRYNDFKRRLNTHITSLGQVREQAPWVLDVNWNDSGLMDMEYSIKLGDGDTEFVDIWQHPVSYRVFGLVVEAQETNNESRELNIKIYELRADTQILICDIKTPIDYEIRSDQLRRSGFIYCSDKELIAVAIKATKNWGTYWGDNNAFFVLAIQQETEPITFLDDEDGIRNEKISYFDRISTRNWQIGNKNLFLLHNESRGSFGYTVIRSEDDLLVLRCAWTLRSEQYNWFAIGRAISMGDTIPMIRRYERNQTDINAPIESLPIDIPLSTAYRGADRVWIIGHDEVMTGIDLDWTVYRLVRTEVDFFTPGNQYQIEVVERAQLSSYDTTIANDYVWESLSSTRIESALLRGKAPVWENYEISGKWLIYDIKYINSPVWIMLSAMTFEGQSLESLIVDLCQFSNSMYFFRGSTLSIMPILTGFDNQSISKAVCELGTHKAEIIDSRKLIPNIRITGGYANDNREMPFDTDYTVSSLRKYYKELNQGIFVFYKFKLPTDIVKNWLIGDIIDIDSGDIQGVLFDKTMGLSLKGKMSEIQIRQVL